MQTNIRQAPEGATPARMPLLRSELTLSELTKLEWAVAWLAQGGCTRAEEVAGILGSLTGREMYCDQPHYNAFAWRSAS